MDETIIAPIGLVMGVITSYARRIKARWESGFNQQSLGQEGLHQQFHLPIKERSPPLSEYQDYITVESTFTNPALHKGRAKLQAISTFAYGLFYAFFRNPT